MQDTLTVKQIAEMFQVSQASVYRMMKSDNPIPSFKIGGSTRFFKVDVLKWVSNSASCSDDVQRILDLLEDSPFHVYARGNFDLNCIEIKKLIKLLMDKNTTSDTLEDFYSSIR